MKKIQHHLYYYTTNKKSPVLVPSVIWDIVTRRILVKEYMDGIPILNLGDEIAKRGIDPDGEIAVVAKQNMLRSLTVYGQMILSRDFFHTDPHPGNIFICRGSEVALLDYGQVKDLPNDPRPGYARLVLDIANNDPIGASQGARIKTLSKCKEEQMEMLKLAQTMFDTKLPPDVTLLQSFSEESSLYRIGVMSFPEESLSILRTVHLLRGLSVGMGLNFSCADQWRHIADEALYLAGRLRGKEWR